MAFKDITKVLYNGSVKIDYKDKAHRYYARERVDYTLPEDSPKAWGKIIYPKGCTTLIGDTLEKKGLMTWPLGLAMRSLLGFYDFTNDEGKKMTGFSKGVGSLWDGESLKPMPQEDVLPLAIDANKAWSNKQKKGADIGSIVHDAIEHHVLANPNVIAPLFDVIPIEDLNDDQKALYEAEKLEHASVTEVFVARLGEDGTPTLGMPELRNSSFDIGAQYMWNIKEAITDIDSPEYAKAMEEFDKDVEAATLAFDQFKAWWNEKRPKLLGAEDLVYSKEFNICGTFDGLIELDGKRVLCDWKTSNASKSKEAAMPEGVNYQYFVQSAIYSMAWHEMHSKVSQTKQGTATITETAYDKTQNIDDLLIVSARKDGGFSLVYASELDLTVQECIDWAKAVIVCSRLASKTKAGLVAHAEPKEGENGKES